ncbi:hypothetical protein EI94DRAFT_1743369 [Lactarius quietus]|nr:hypothetical protein EI94DRAFT_1743369 [Lactarius quietus]
MERMAPLKTAQTPSTTQVTNCAERERENEKNDSTAGFFSHRPGAVTFIHWLFIFRHKVLAPRALPLSSTHRFRRTLLLLENELFSFLGLMGDGHRRRRENVQHSQVGPDSLFGGLYHRYVRRRRRRRRHCCCRRRCRRRRRRRASDPRRRFFAQ